MDDIKDQIIFDKQLFLPKNNNKIVLSFFNPSKSRHF